MNNMSIWCCPVIPDTDDASSSMCCGQNNLSVGKLDSIATYLFFVHIISEITTYTLRLYVDHIGNAQWYTILVCIQFLINAVCFVALGFAFNKLDINTRNSVDTDSKRVQFFMIACPIGGISLLSMIEFAVYLDFTALAQFGVDSCGYSFLTLVWYVDLTDVLNGSMAKIVHGRRRTVMFALFVFFSIFVVVANVVHESDSHIAEDTLKYLYSVTEVILLFEIMHLVIESTLEARKIMHEAQHELHEANANNSLREHLI